MARNERNERIVREFFAAWTKLDPDRIVDFFSEDAVYHNIPLQRIEGKPAIRETIAGWCGQMESIDFVFRHIVSEGDLVLMERCDVVPSPSGPHELPIMAILELRDGKIAAWREYFDLAQMNAASAG